MSDLGLLTYYFRIEVKQGKSSTEASGEDDRVQGVPDTDGGEAPVVEGKHRAEVRCDMLWSIVIKLHVGTGYATEVVAMGDGWPGLGFPVTERL